MPCSICNKNPGTVHFKQIFQNQVTPLVLCESCAAKLALGPGPELSMLLGMLKEFGGGEVLREYRSPAQPKCPTCGLRQSQFQESGRLGCPDCYEAFKPLLSELFNQIHGKTSHKGRRPAGEPAVNPALNLEQLRRKLKAAVENEKYEEAAAIRDRIRELERGA